MSLPPIGITVEEYHTVTRLQSRIDGYRIARQRIFDFTRITRFPTDYAILQYDNKIRELVRQGRKILCTPAKEKAFDEWEEWVILVMYRRLGGIQANTEQEMAGLEVLREPEVIGAADTQVSVSDPCFLLPHPNSRHRFISSLPPT
jgi:hypothetical protein